MLVPMMGQALNSCAHVLQQFLTDWQLLAEHLGEVVDDINCVLNLWVTRPPHFSYAHASTFLMNCCFSFDTMVTARSAVEHGTQSATTRPGVQVSHNGCGHGDGHKPETLE